MSSSALRALLRRDAASSSSSTFVAAGFSAAILLFRRQRGRGRHRNRLRFRSAVPLRPAKPALPHCRRPTRRRRSPTNVRQRLSDVSPVQSARSAAWVSSKMIGRSQVSIMAGTSLLRAIGQRRLGAHPARGDRARRPQDDHRFGRPQLLFDDLVECLTRTQDGVPPHAETLRERRIPRSAGPRPGLPGCKR